MNRVWIVLLTALLATNAFAQTGPVAEAPDNSGVLPTFAVALLIATAMLVLALFQPWKWLSARKPKGKLRPPQPPPEFTPPGRRPYFPQKPDGDA